jgi:hypothetical protein
MSKMARPVKALMVGCCGCGRLLMADGKLTPFSILNGGVIDRAAIEGAAQSAVTFDTKAECDSAARAAGWGVSDGNHRCPACYAEQRSQRMGMYIDSRTLEVCA